MEMEEMKQADENKLLSSGSPLKEPLASQLEPTVSVAMTAAGRPLCEVVALVEDNKSQKKSFPGMDDKATLVTESKAKIDNRANGKKPSAERTEHANRRIDGYKLTVKGRRRANKIIKELGRHFILYRAGVGENPLLGGSVLASAGEARATTTKDGGEFGEYDYASVLIRGPGLEQLEACERAWKARQEREWTKILEAANVHPGRGKENELEKSGGELPLSPEDKPEKVVESEQGTETLEKEMK